MASDLTQRETPFHDVTLPMVPPGLVIDVGGGGEGIVSRLAAGRVCVADMSLNKIREARIYGASAEWFVCDGRMLPFRSRSFDSATLWFSLAYIRSRDGRERALRETSRVLQDGGSLSILGMVLEGSSDAMTFNGRFVYPDGYVSKMSYRVRGNQEQSHQIIRELLEKLGFGVTSISDHVYWFEVMATKRG